MRPKKRRKGALIALKSVVGANGPQGRSALGRKRQIVANWERTTRPKARPADPLAKSPSGPRRIRASSAAQNQKKPCLPALSPRPRPSPMGQMSRKIAAKIHKKCHANPTMTKQDNQ